MHQVNALPENDASMNYDEFFEMFANEKCPIMQVGSWATDKIINSPVNDDVVFRYAPFYPTVTPTKLWV